MPNELEKKACELCAKNNGSTCTTPQPDSKHWICKEWLKRVAETQMPNKLTDIEKEGGNESC